MERSRTLLHFIVHMRKEREAGNSSLMEWYVVSLCRWVNEKDNMPKCLADLLMITTVMTITPDR